MLWFPAVKITGNLANAVKYIKDGENRISFIKHVEITDRKADTMYSALSNEIQKCGEAENLSGFGSDGASVMIGHKKKCLKIKKELSQYIHTLSQL